MMQKRRRVSDSVLTGVLPALGLKKNAANINTRGGHLASSSTVTSPLPWAVINFEIFWVLLSPNTKCADRLAKSCGVRSFQGSEGHHQCHESRGGQGSRCLKAHGCGSHACGGDPPEVKALEDDKRDRVEGDADANSSVVHFRRHSADPLRKLGVASPRTKRCRSGSWTSQRCSNGSVCESQGVGARRCHGQAGAATEGGRRSVSGLPQANGGGRCCCCCCCCSCSCCSTMNQAEIIKEVTIQGFQRCITVHTPTSEPVSRRCPV